MPKTTPGEAVPNVAERANKTWFVFKHFNPGSATDPRLAYVTGYHRGVADMLTDMFQLGDWDTKTDRLLAVFEYLANQRDAIRTLMNDPENLEVR